MSIREWFNKATSPQVVAWIGSTFVTPRVTETPIKSEETYIRISLAEMVLAKSRDWFVDCQPMVSAITRLKFGDQLVELPAVACVDPKQFAPGRSVLQNYRILDLVPFRGGTIELEAALLAQPGRDLVTNAIRGLSNIASLVAAPLAGALEVAKKVKESVEMFGGNGTDVHLAYHNTFTAQVGENQLHDGYLAIVRMSPQHLEGMLVVDHNQLRTWDGQGAAQPLDRDYLLFRFEVVSKRDDLHAFSDLEKLRAATITAAIKGDPDLDRSYQNALLAILFHPDLINADRRTLAGEFKAECDAYRVLPHGSAPPPTRTWAEFVGALRVSTDNSPVTLAEFA